MNFFNCESIETKIKKIIQYHNSYIKKQIRIPLHRQQRTDSPQPQHYPFLLPKLHNHLQTRIKNNQFRIKIQTKPPN